MTEAFKKNITTTEPSKRPHICHPEPVEGSIVHMTEHPKKNITTAELSENAREWFENLTEQYRAILTKYNTTNIKDFITKNPTKKDLTECVELLRQLKHIAKAKETPDDQANRRLQHHIDNANLFFKYEKEMERPEEDRRIKPYSEGLAAIRLNFNAWYLINTEGEKMLGPYEKIISMFKQGRAIIKNNKKQHLINKQGEILYSAFSIPYNGTFPILTKNNEGWKLIDKDGKLIENGNLGRPIELSRKIYRVHTNEGWVLINEQGIRYPFKPTHTSITFCGQFTSVEKDDGYYIINKQGEVMPGGPFDEISQSNNELIPTKNGKQYRLDKTGRAHPTTKRTKKRKKKQEEEEQKEEERAKRDKWY